MQKLTQRADGPGFPRRSSTRGRRAFTLLEILLVLALIGLLSGMMITGATRMLNPGPETPTQAFWTMAGAARRYALLNETEVRMSYDTTTGELVASATNGTDLPPVKVPGGGDLVFISGISPTALASPNTAVGSVFGDILGNGTDTTISSVVFYRDGTCTPFRVTVEGATAGNDAASPTIAVDPWTGGPMLVAVATNSAGLGQRSF